MRNLLYILIPALLITFSGCKKEKIYIDREVIVEVEVEVDTSPMPDSLKKFLDNELNQYNLNVAINSFKNRATYVIVSFGKNSNSLNSYYPNGLSESCISMQAYNGNTREYYSTLRVDGTNRNLEFQPPGTFIEFNPYFYDENQYVYKIVTFIPQ